jgi:hypothetical protein
MGQTSVDVFWADRLLAYTAFEGWAEFFEVCSVLLSAVLQLLEGSKGRG